MKKIIGVLVVICILTSSVGIIATEFVTQRADFNVFLWGQKFVTDRPILEVNGMTYIALTDVGKISDVPVNWNNERHCVEVGEGYIRFFRYDLVPDFGIRYGVEPFEYEIDDDEYNSVRYDLTKIDKKDIDEYLKLLQEIGWEPYSWFEFEETSSYAFSHKNADFCLCISTQNQEHSKQLSILFVP